MRSLACTLVFALLSGSWPAPAYSATLSAANLGTSGPPGGGYLVGLATELHRQVDQSASLLVAGLSIPNAPVGGDSQDLMSHHGLASWVSLSRNLVPDAPQERQDAALLLASALVHPDTFLPGVLEALRGISPAQRPELGRQAAERLAWLVRSFRFNDSDRKVVERLVSERGLRLWDSPEPLLAKALEAGRARRDRALDAAVQVAALPPPTAFDGADGRRAAEGAWPVETAAAPASARPGLLAGAPDAAASVAQAPIPAPAKAETFAGKDSLPAREYHPYLFFWANHLLFFYLYVPFFSLEVLKAGDSWVPWYVTSYAAGSFARSMIQIFRPGWLGLMSKGAWTLVGLGTTLLFLGATLAGVSALTSVLLAFPLGIGISAGLVQWKSYYQKELAKDRQPAVFRRLSDLGVLGTLLPFAALSGAGLLFPAVSIPFLLILVAAGMGLVALSTLWTLLKGGALDQGPAKAGAKTAGGLPGAYWWYLTGLFLSSAGQAIMTSLAPILAYGAKGALFTFGSQALGLGAIIAGSWAGKRWVEARGAKSAYLWANVLNGLGFVPLILALFSPVFAIPALLFFSFVGGFTFGAMRGVAEQQITVDVLGQGNEGLLNKANSMYYALVSPAYIGTSFLTAWLMPLLGTTPFIVIGALFMFASLLPFLMVRVRPAQADGIGLVDSPQAEAEAKALLMEYWRDFVRPYSDEAQDILDELEGRRPWPFAAPRGRMLRVLDGGRIAGVVGLVDAGRPGFMEIKRFYVSPDYRGKGYGKKLMLAAVEQARAAGARAIRLETHREKMPDAVKLYKALGFVESAYDEKESDPSWTWMELKLAPAVEEVRTAQDFGAVKPLLEAYADERLPDGSFLLPDEDRAEIRRELEHFPHWPFAPPAGTFLRAVSGGETIGTAGLVWQSPGVLELRRFYVRPESRNSGNGAAILEAVLGEARRRGASAIRLGTHRARMPDAVRLYERAGFREMGPYSAEFPDWIWMELKLR